MKVGLGWDSQQTRGEKKRVWGALTAGSRHGDENDPHPITHPVLPVAPFSAVNGVNGVKESNGHMEVAPVAPTPSQPQSQPQPQEPEEEEEEELEEWEIEAERRFQDSDVDDAPALPALKKSTTPVKPKVTTPELVANKKPSPVLEQAAAVDQEQVKRRRKMWPRK